MTGVCVCVFVCLQAYLWKYTSDLYQFFCACYPWPWLGPPLVALQYKQVNNINSAKIKNRTKGGITPRSLLRAAASSATASNSTN